VRSRQVVFVIAPGQGIEPIPAQLSLADTASLTGRLHARVIARGHGVTVLSWLPPPGASTIVLP
jgi:hypothetical protein